jgi:hypothetical protein
MLVAPFFKDEVHNVVFSMASDKQQGLMGFLFIFINISGLSLNLI